MTQPYRPFRKLLIANRGEIALRIARTARRLGIATVAVFSDADRAAPHVAAADEACFLGASEPRRSYLDAARIVEAALAAGAEAVHPGYGFLAENAEFASAVGRAGLVFVGPPPEAIRLMGDKGVAKRRMASAGVPCVPGFQPDAGAGAPPAGDDVIAAAATRVGFPVMVKAAAGGGGRGMRRVESAATLRDALRSARSEAQAAFGSGELILERAIPDARHVEVQIFADASGHTIHLGERDCSVQRRHQKLIEESPSPAVSPELRARLGAAAIAAARAVGYVGAGTVEFLLDREGQFYFMEMNTRLQVEHPVTEAVTGLDLVELQLRVAAGAPLGLRQEDVRAEGHAIEARVCAEDPAREFLPQTGRVLLWRRPAGVRVDDALADGLEIGPHYDSMLAKVIAHGRDRSDAIRQLVRALQTSILLGVRHNAEFLRRCVEHEVFQAGGATTSFVERSFPARARASDPVPPLAIAVGAALAYLRDNPDPNPWSNGLDRFSLLRLDVAGDVVTVRVDPAPDGSLSVTIGQAADAERVELGRVRLHGSSIRFENAGVETEAVFAATRERVTLHLRGTSCDFAVATWSPAAGRDEAAADGVIKAPITGKVVARRASPGGRVRKGDVLVVLEAMKMESPVVAPFDGIVGEVACAVADQVVAGGTLLHLARVEALP